MAEQDARPVLRPSHWRPLRPSRSARCLPPRAGSPSATRGSRAPGRSSPAPPPPPAWSTPRTPGTPRRGMSTPAATSAITSRLVPAGLIITMSAASATSRATSRIDSRRLAGILLVGAPVPGQRRVDRLPERSVEGRGVLGRVREDHGVAVPGVVERAAHRRDLAVHHPRGPHHVGPGRGQRESHLRVARQGGVVVHSPGCGTVLDEHSAVAMVGELVQAQVGHDDDVAADLSHNVANREVEDPLRIGRAGPGRIPGARDAEEHHPAEPGASSLLRSDPERVARVVHHPRHRGDRHRLTGALPDEQGQDQLSLGRVGSRPSAGAAPRVPRRRLGRSCG